MRKMTTFTPVRLPRDMDNLSYLQAIKAFRRWAGPHVYLGEAGVIATGKEGELVLYELTINHITSLNLNVGEMHGATLSYTAKAPVDATASCAGFVEVIRVHMRVDPGSAIWITGLSAVKEDPPGKSEWCVQLTPQARKLAIAIFLASNGVDPGVDVFALANAIEAEENRLVALTQA